LIGAFATRIIEARDKVRHIAHKVKVWRAKKWAKKWFGKLEMRMRKLATVFLAMIFLMGCTVGPNYHRPPVDIPQVYQNEAPDQTSSSIGDEKWFEVFQDQALQNLIRTAIAQNYDLRIAASRILQAQEQLGITRSDQYPKVGANVGYTSQRFPGFSFSYTQLLGLFNWDVDFWGKYRRATEAARANLLAAEWNQREVISTIVSSVAMAYFQLLELDAELEISRNTMASRNQSLRLTRIEEQGGTVSLLDVSQAQVLVETAAEAIPENELLISQQEDLISTLMGENPHNIPRGRPLTEQPLPVTIPAGLPSRLIERRPDIRRAEQQLIAFNAQIGVARAAFFPSLPLTESAGAESPALAQLFTTPAWTLATPLTQQIFTAGQLRSNLRFAQAQREESVLSYQQTIQQAFRQVSDALIAYRKSGEFLEHQEALTNAAQQAANISEIRFRGGVTNYLEVLTNETNYFSAELNLARAQLNERLALVQLYIALGGGWEQ
jgi:outer membrane protein, multidrug efflux system